MELNKMQETNKELQVCCQCNIEKECAPGTDKEGNIVWWMCQECAEAMFGGEEEETPDPTKPIQPDLF